jgi:hypothetical protein
MSLRKQFEAFAMEKLVVSRGDLLLTDSGKRYRCVDIEQAWEIFQAGYAAYREELAAAARAASSVIGEDGEDEPE